MAYINRTFATRRTVGRRTASAELVFLVIAVAAALGTGFWISHMVGMDLSGITTAASVLGLTETDKHAKAGYVATAASEAAPSAPFCSAGQTPTFSASVAALAVEVGDAIGSPVECEHTISPTGDSIQLTTTGLVAYDKLRDTVSFTDGWRHWAVTPRGVVAWEGTDSLPPAG
jgi:hypothetical protein